MERNTTVEDTLGDFNRLYALLFISFGWFFILGIRYVIPALLPSIITEFSITNTMAGFSITALWFAYALAQFPSGIIIDWSNERNVLLISLSLTILSLLFFSISVAFAVFFFGCLLYGWGSGFYGTPRATILSKMFPYKSGIVFGTVLSVGSIGGALLPIGAMYVANTSNWRVPFLLLAPLVIIVCIGIAYILPRKQVESSRSLGSRLDKVLLRSTVDAIGDRSVLPAAVGATLMTFTFQALTAFFPIYLVSAKSVSQSVATLLFGLLFVSGAVVQPVSGHIADRIGYIRTLVALSALTVIPFVALPFTESLPVLSALAFLFGIQQGLVPVNNAYTVNALPVDIQGSAWGFIRTLMFAIGSLGSLFVGALFDLDYYDEAFIALAVIAVFTLVLYWWLSKVN